MEVFINDEWIQIGSIYIPPNLKINGVPYHLSRKNLEAIFSVQKKSIFGGDFNARSINWGDLSENSYGKIIWDFTLNSDIKLHASNLPTCFRSETGSYIDFFLTRDIDYPLNCKTVPSFSDHNAIFIDFSYESKNSSSPLRIVKQYNLTNVNKFILEKLGEVNIPNNKNLTNNNIDKIALEIDQIFQEATEKFIPSTQIPIGNIILSSQTKLLNKKFKSISRKRFRNKLNNNKTINSQYNLIKNMYINSIKNDINLHYKKYLMDISSNLNVFEAVRRLTKHKKKETNIEKIFLDSDKSVTSISTPDQICEGFAELFKTIILL